jgi:hypothetical protein
MAFWPPQFADGDWGALRRTLEWMSRRLVDAGGGAIALRFGVATITWGGGTPNSNVKTVTHGLGRTPVIILVTINAGSVIGPAWTGAPGATTFDVAGRTHDSSNPAAATTTNVSWLVIG